jgi:hypothetical protein
MLDGRKPEICPIDDTKLVMLETTAPLLRISNADVNSSSSQRQPNAANREEHRRHATFGRITDDNMRRAHM